MGLRVSRNLMLSELDCCLCGETANGVLAGHSLCLFCANKIIKEWFKEKRPKIKARGIKFVRG